MQLLVEAFTASQTSIDPAKALEYTVYGNVHTAGKLRNAQDDTWPVCKQPHMDDTKTPRACTATFNSL